MTISEIEAAVAVATAIATGTVGVYRMVVRPFMIEPARAISSRVETGLKKLDALDVEVASIKAALGPNGGSSLADSITRTERVVRRLDARQTALAHAVTRPVFEADSRGHITDVNPAFLELTGYDVGDVLGLSWVNLVHHDCRDRVMREYEHAIADVRLFRERAKFVTRSGGVINVSMEARPMLDPASHETVGWFGTVHLANSSGDIVTGTGGA